MFGVLAGVSAVHDILGVTDGGSLAGKDTDWAQSDNFFGAAVLLSCVPIDILQRDVARTAILPPAFITLSGQRNGFRSSMASRRRLESALQDARSPSNSTSDR